MKKSILDKIIREEVKAALGEQVNPDMKYTQAFESFINGATDLKSYLAKKYPGFKMYPAETGEINVGFLKKDNDYTWNNVMTYYWNTNSDLDECSVNKVKI